MPSMYRLAHAEQNIARHIGLLIVQGRVRDPRVPTVLSVTGVKLSRDLHHAHVKISGYVRPEGLQKAVDGLNHAAGYIQHHIAHHLRMRMVPKLHFVADEGIYGEFQMTQMLKRISNEDQSAGQSESAGQAKDQTAGESEQASQGRTP